MLNQVQHDEKKQKIVILNIGASLKKSKQKVERNQYAALKNGFFSHL